jgi:PIN domain nuclease of toxin-antitoxin system
MAPPILLDTCALIWIAEEARLKQTALAALDETQGKEKVYVSPISAWELGLLTVRRRFSPIMSLDALFQRFLEKPGMALAPLPPSTLIAASFLPGTPPNDPADRIIIATARAEGFRVMTRDHLILGYGDSGHVATIAC